MSLAQAITSQHVPQHVTQHVIEQAEQKTDTKSKDTTSKKPLPGCITQGFLVAVAMWGISYGSLKETSVVPSHLHLCMVGPQGLLSSTRTAKDVTYLCTHTECINPQLEDAE